MFIPFFMKLVISLVLDNLVINILDHLFIFLRVPETILLSTYYLPCCLSYHLINELLNFIVLINKLLLLIFVESKLKIMKCWTFIFFKVFSIKFLTFTLTRFINEIILLISVIFSFKEIFLQCIKITNVMKGRLLILFWIFH